MILSSGEITLISLAEGAVNVETVGAVEGGVQAAEWSPDDEQVVLVTGRPKPLVREKNGTDREIGEEQVMLMSREFEVVYESPLRTEEFGEGTFPLFSFFTKGR